MDGSETAVPLTHRHPQGGGSMSEHDAGQAKPSRGGEDGEGMTYADAGVDIRAGEEAVRLIREQVDSTTIPGVLGGLGGFAGLYELPADMDRPVLVTATDGVGTKLLIAQEAGKLNTVGIDLVAMCVNDVVTAGASPVLFLDYIATGRLEPEEVVEVVSGVAKGCREAGCALIGGETAEMPGLYRAGEEPMYLGAVVGSDRGGVTLEGIC